MKTTYKQQIGKIVKKECGKSEAKMGDAMQIVNATFDKIVSDASFLAQGISKAIARKKRK